MSRKILKRVYIPAEQEAQQRAFQQRLTNRLENNENPPAAKPAFHGKNSGSNRSRSSYTMPKRSTRYSPVPPRFKNSPGM